MKELSLSLAAFLAIGTFAVAGGDIAPVEPAVEVPAPVVASEGGFYIGGAISSYDVSMDAKLFDYDGYEVASASGSGDDYTFMLQAGYEFNDYFSVEGRYWFESSFTMDGTNNQDGSWSDDADFSAWGIYIKPMYPLTDALDVYGLLGYGNTTVKAPDGFKLVDEDGFQWGVGTSYAFNENFSVFVDYVQLCADAKTTYSIDGMTAVYKSDIYTINLGITYKF